MLRGVLLVCLLLLPLALAAAPSPMSVAGALEVNGAPAAAGTRLVVAATGGAPLVEVRVAGGGTFQALVPADDAATPAREGGVEGEALEFFAAGARAVGANVEYRAGQQARGLRLAAVAPDLALVGASASPAQAREGENVTLQGSVANRGRALAAGVSVTASEGGRLLASAVVGDVPVNASRGFTLVLPTTGLAGARSILVGVVGEDADATNDDTVVAVDVSARGAPVVASFSIVPAEPAPGDQVVAVVDATDEDGIARVVFHWDDGGGERTQLVAAPPYQAALGVFPAGARVRYWAVATEATEEARSTATPVREFAVAFPVVPSPATTPAPTEPVEPSPTTPSTEPALTREEPLPAGVAIAALAVASLYLLRRRT